MEGVARIRKLQIRYSDLQSSTKLFLNFINRPGSLAEWLGHDFRDKITYESVAANLDGSTYRRSELSAVLLEQNEEFGAPVESLKNAELLAEDRTLCVIAGHQVSLLGGPLMIMYKAITVIKLASKLTESLGRTVVPVFWLATDDHDLAEADHVHLPDRDGRLIKIKYEPAKPIIDLPMSDVVFDQNISVFLDQVMELLQETEYRDELVERLRSCFAENQSIYSAFGNCLLRYLGKYGLVLVNPADVTLRIMARDILETEIKSFTDSQRLVTEANSQLMNAGYHVQVSRHERYLNLFLYTGRRSRVGHEAGAYFIDGTDQRYTQDEILKLLDSDPAMFSPNVLLRPIVQSRLFPAIAFVGGPAEIAYSCQMGALFDHFGVTKPVVCPRLSATIIESRWRKFIEKHSLDLCRLQSYENREAMLTSVLEKSFPKGLEDAFTVRHGAILSELKQVQALIESDGMLTRTFEQTRKKIDYELKAFREKVFKNHRKANEDFTRRFRRCAETLFPEQSVQDRHYSFIYFANKYGPRIVDMIHDSLDIDNWDHQIIEL